MLSRSNKAWEFQQIASFSKVLMSALMRALWLVNPTKWKKARSHRKTMNTTLIHSFSARLSFAKDKVPPWFVLLVLTLARVWPKKNFKQKRIRPHSSKNLSRSQTLSLSLELFSPFLPSFSAAEESLSLMFGSHLRTSRMYGRLAALSDSSYRHSFLELQS